MKIKLKNENDIVNDFSFFFFCNEEVILLFFFNEKYCDAITNSLSYERGHLITFGCVGHISNEQSN